MNAETILDNFGRHEPWMDDALCAQTDAEAFFPEKGGSSRDAKAVCVKCDVRAQCLAYALANGERFGIWGGLSERERRKLAGDTRQPNAGKTQCINRHEFTPENTIHSTYVASDGTNRERRSCRTCRVERGWEKAS